MSNNAWVLGKKRARGDSIRNSEAVTPLKKGASINTLRATNIFENKTVDSELNLT